MHEESHVATGTRNTAETNNDVLIGAEFTPRTRAHWVRTGIAAAAVAAVGMITFGAPALAQGANGAPASVEPAILNSFAATPETTPAPPVNLDTAADQRAESLSVITDKVTQTQTAEALSARVNALGTTSTQIEAESERLLSLKFAWPTDGGITSPWGMRFHPILRYTRMHGGVDIGGTCGQPIWAVRDGVVTDRSSGSQSGNQLRIDHGDMDGTNVQSAYLHIDEFRVSVGDQVKRGQVIATVGSTGLSTACHLHFAAYENGTNVDPEKFLNK